MLSLRWGREVLRSASPTIHHRLQPGTRSCGAPFSSSAPSSSRSPPWSPRPSKKGKKSKNKPAPGARQVAGSFLFKFPDGDLTQKPLVALFRRSESAIPYPGKWGVISGGIEQTDHGPLAAAYRELAEETGLPRSSLKLFRQGAPYHLTDPQSLMLHWRVFPFGFILDPQAERHIRLRFGENSEFEWFDPDAVPDDDCDDAEFDGVPGLAQSLRNVWFEREIGYAAGAALAAGVEELAGMVRRRCTKQELQSQAAILVHKIAEKMDVQCDKSVWAERIELLRWYLWVDGCGMQKTMGVAGPWADRLSEWKS